MPIGLTYDPIEKVLLLLFYTRIRDNKVRRLSASTATTRKITAAKQFFASYPKLILDGALSFEKVQSSNVAEVKAKRDGGMQIWQFLKGTERSMLKF